MYGRARWRRFLAQKGTKLAGHFRYQVEKVLLAVGEVVPDTIGHQGEQGRQHEHRAAWYSPLGGKGRKVELYLAVDARHFLVEQPDHFLAIEAKVVGIAAHEARGIGHAGKVLEPTLLYGLQVGEANMQLCGDRRQILPKALALLPQDLAHAKPRRRQLVVCGLAAVTQGRFDLVLRFHLDHAWTLRGRSLSSAHEAAARACHPAPDFGRLGVGCAQAEFYQMAVGLSNRKIEKSRLKSPHRGRGHRPQARGECWSVPGSLVHRYRTAGARYRRCEAWISPRPPPR